jgi:hypothetical protein
MKKPASDREQQRGGGGLYPRRHPFHPPTRKQDVDEADRAAEQHQRAGGA